MKLLIKTIAGVVLLFSIAIPCKASEPLTLAIPYPISTVDPLLLTEPLNRIVLSNISGGLTTLDSKGRSSLVLASSVQRRDGGAQWVFKIKPNLRFSSGGLITADSVVHSMRFLQSRGLRLPAPFDQFYIKDVRRGSWDEALGENVVFFELSGPEPAFPSLLSVLPVLEVGVAKRFGNDFGVGTNGVYRGPYQISDNRPGEGLVLKSVPDYSDVKKNQAPLIHFRHYPSAKKALRALRLGHVAIIPLPTQEQLNEVKKDPSLAIFNSPLKHLGKYSGPWRLKNNHWSDGDETNDSLTTDVFIVRKSLSVDEAFLSQFDLSGAHLP